MRKLRRLFWSKLGIEVKRVEDGLQCIEELKKMPENYYDVILMDVQMPNMDGYTATQRIRDLDDSRAEIPIIAMTANAYDEDRRKAQEAGMDGFLAKPLDVDEMMRLLGENYKNRINETVRNAGFFWRKIPAFFYLKCIDKSLYYDIIQSNHRKHI